MRKPVFPGGRREARPNGSRARLIRKLAFDRPLGPRVIGEISYEAEMFTGEINRMRPLISDQGTHHPTTPCPARPVDNAPIPTNSTVVVDPHHSDIPHPTDLDKARPNMPGEESLSSDPDAEEEEGDENHQRGNNCTQTND